jgi:hypothetical protein
VVGTPSQVDDFLDPTSVWGPALCAQVTGAASSELSRVLIDVINEFLRFSTSLRVEAFVDIHANRPDVNINDVLGTSELFIPLVHAINLFGVWRQPALVPDNNFYSTGSAAIPFRAFVINPGVLRMFPAPTEDIPSGLGMRISYTLIRPATCAPKFVSDYYYEAILDGALGRMFLQPKRPYSDVALAKYHLQRFRNGIRMAREEADRRWSNSELAVPLSPSFANTGRVYRRG